MRLKMDGFLAGLVSAIFVCCCQPSFAQKGWQALFNGQNFDGWEKKNGTASYEIRDGTIVGISQLNTPNTFLCTKETYADFILEMDVKIDVGLNSGIQVRSLSLPEVDNGRVHGYQVEIDPAERAWSGGIYDEARQGWLYPLSINEKGRSAFKNGEWNRYHIEAVGNTIRTWVNGVQCANLIIDLTPEGFIALQVHGIKQKSQEGLTVQWRNIRIKTEDLAADCWKPDNDVEEVSYLTNQLTKRQIDEGWRLLWDGKTTAGWRRASAKDFPPTGWQIENGLLKVLPSEKGDPNKGGDIVTDREFSNFELELDFLITEGGNSGIKYLVVEELRQRPGTGLGPEYQILDDERHPDAKNGVDGNRTAGSLYDLITAGNLSEPGKNKRINKPGKWNRAKIVVNGNHVEHWLNHIKVVEYDRGSAAFKALVAKSKFHEVPDFGQALSGHILLQDHGDAAYFKNIKIKELAAPVDLVQPLVDAANSRWFFFNSATRPFGMVNLSPDMEVDGDWGTGYRYHQDTIRCFSHVHGWQLSGIPVLPTTGPFRGHLGPHVYGSAYTHQQEIVRPGYHKIVLDDYGITAELTSTTRVGFHRYTFPKSRESHILFDFTTALGPSKTDRGYARKVNDREIEGYAVMGATVRRPKPVTVYFTARIDKPFQQFSGWQNGELINGIEEVDGEHTGIFISFPTAQDEEVQLKVAISYVSVEQARLNLDVELPHWDFDRVVRESRGEWNQWLSRITVEGGTLEERQRFYTDLWHALQGRRIISDVNGKYCDMTGSSPRIGQIPLDEKGKPTFNHHNSDSFWGAQWTINTLWHLVYPEVTHSFVNSILLMYDDGGLIPRGPAGGNYTFVMTGASSTPFIVSAYMKGIHGFDVKKAYEGLRKNHLPGGLMSKAGYEHDTFKGGGIEQYIDKGYVPYPLSNIRYGYHQNGAAQTLEYAYQDFALSQLAHALGKTDDAQLFRRRAENYKNLWNNELGWMWVKDSTGRWRSPANVLTYENGWVEGNAAQYTWFVPHDVAGLINLMGGADRFSGKLDSVFQVAQSHHFTSGKSHSVETHAQNREVYLNYGNQPSIHTAFLFNYAGTPYLTQYWTRQVVKEVYSGISPDYGYSGDEDQGLMGALAVLFKIGLFTTDGGVSTTPIYEIGSPIFDKITLRLNPDYYPGKKFVIETRHNSPKNCYIQSATLNGNPLDRAWIPHDVMVKGGTLRLDMGDAPNKQFGALPELVPPSMSAIETKQ